MVGRPERTSDKSRCHGQKFGEAVITTKRRVIGEIVGRFFPRSQSAPEVITGRQFPVDLSKALEKNEDRALNTWGQKTSSPSVHSVKVYSAGGVFSPALCLLGRYIGAYILQ